MTPLERLTKAAEAVLATDFARGQARLADETDRAAHKRLRVALMDAGVRHVDQAQSSPPCGA